LEWPDHISFASASGQSNQLAHDKSYIDGAFFLAIGLFGTV
jgi:hypothetical protein